MVQGFLPRFKLDVPQHFWESMAPMKLGSYAGQLWISQTLGGMFVIHLEMQSVTSTSNWAYFIKACPHLFSFHLLNRTFEHERKGQWNGTDEVTKHDHSPLHHTRINKSSLKTVDSSGLGILTDLLWVQVLLLSKWSYYLIQVILSKCCYYFIIVLIWCHLQYSNKCKLFQVYTRLKVSYSTCLFKRP